MSAAQRGHIIFTARQLTTTAPIAMVKVPFGLSTAEVQAASQYDSGMRLRRCLAMPIQNHLLYCRLSISFKQLCREPPKAVSGAAMGRRRVQLSRSVPFTLLLRDQRVMTPDAACSRKKLTGGGLT
jgi:hypothetical protein